MKKILSRFLFAVLIITIMLGGSFSAAGAESSAIKVQFNGGYITFTDAAPKMISNRTMVPFRQIFEAMGASVSYDASTKTILAKTDTKELSFTVDGSDLTTTENGVKTTEKMDVIPYLDAKSGRIYVPVRFIAESLDSQVGWNASEKTVTIFNPAVKYMSMTYKPRANLTVGINYNLELMQIAAAHSADFKHNGYVGRDSALNTAIKEYFSKFAKRDYESSLYSQSMDGAVDKLYHGETDYILCYDSNLTYKPLTTDRPDEFASSGKVTNEAQLLAAVKDFKTYTKADQFFADNKTLYQDVMNNFKKQVDFDFIGQLQTLTGVNMNDAQFLLIASPSMEGGMAITLTDPTGNPVYVNITNPSDNFAEMIQTLYHEEIHNFIEPALRDNWDTYSNSHFIGVLNQDTGDNGNAFNETVTRALTNIAIEQYQPAVDTSSLMKEYLSSGWINTDKVYNLIKTEYLPNRDKYKTIGDFLQRSQSI